MKISLERHINPNANDSDSSPGTSLNFGADVKKVEAEEDGVSEKIGAAFDQLLK